MNTSLSDLRQAPHSLPWVLRVALGVCGLLLVGSFHLEVRVNPVPMAHDGSSVNTGKVPALGASSSWLWQKASGLVWHLEAGTRMAVHYSGAQAQSTAVGPPHAHVCPGHRAAVLSNARATAPAFLQGGGHGHIARACT